VASRGRKEPVIDFGIASIGLSLGERDNVADTAALYAVDPTQLQRRGYEHYHRAADSVTATDLAAEAVAAAFADATVETSAVEYLILASSSVPEYLKWDASTALARRANLGRIPTLLLTQTCASAVIAFQSAAGLFATRPDLDTVLLVAVNRVSEAHINRLSSNAESDGAAAVLLKRHHPELRWLATEQVTEPAWADFFRLEYGGSAQPFPPRGTTNRDVDPQLQVLNEFRGRPDAFLEFSKTLDTRVADAVRAACDRVGVAVSDVSRLIYLNDSEESLRVVADSVGIAFERMNADLSSAHGHFGCADPLIGLGIYRSQDQLQKGEVVALAGLAQGMHWFCTLIEV